MLIDEVIRSDIRVYLENLREARVVRVDNVAKYFYEDSPQVDWPMTAFPNLAPPFGNLWFEFPAPHTVNNAGKIMHLSPEFKGVYGLWFRSFTREDAPDELRDAFIPGAKWVTEIYPFSIYDQDHLPYYWGMAWVYLVAPNGKAIGQPSLNLPDQLAYVAIQNVSLEDPENLPFIHSVFQAVCSPALLAISFMHCGNVAQVEHQPQASPSGRRRHAAQVNRYRITYRTLEIEPLARPARASSPGTGTGGHRSLHICRGHFANYEKKGLFGKYHGIFWKPDTVKGSRAVGEARKYYNISPPKSG